MEAVQSDLDANLLDWLPRQPIKREWFFEQRDGNWVEFRLAEPSIRGAHSAAMRFNV
jgi:hypothetical protein